MCYSGLCDLIQIVRVASVTRFVISFGISLRQIKHLIEYTSSNFSMARELFRTRVTTLSILYKDLIVEELSPQKQTVQLLRIRTELETLRFLSLWMDREHRQKYIDLFDRVIASHEEAKDTLGDAISKKVKTEGYVECGICLHERSLKNMRQFSCRHEVCRGCFRRLSTCPYRCEGMNKESNEDQ